MLLLGRPRSLTRQRQRTLEELDYIFGVPTRRQVAYQIRTWLPWAGKRHLFFQRGARLEPLYDDDNVGLVTEDSKDV